ncbi:metallophosphoesterase family protein [Thermococcus sp.]
MKKLLVLFLIGIIVLSAGCMGGKTASSTSSTAPSSTTSTTSTVTTSATPSETSSAPTMTTTTPEVQEIDFKKYRRGELLQRWSELFSSKVVYVSKGYEALARHYFPGAEIKPAEDFIQGIAILSPADARKLLGGKPILITFNDYFGYVAYKVGFRFVGGDQGVMIIYKEMGRDRLIFTGTSRAGVGAALEYAMEVKNGKRKVNAVYALRRGEFEGIIVKEIGDNNWNGIEDKGEYWLLSEVYFKEPFLYYWRVVEGENVTVKGGFIRLVNGSTVYIYAKSFNISVNVKDYKGAKLTYVIENINPSVMNIPSGAEAGTTWVKLQTDRQSFLIDAKPVSNFTFLAVGDHRPGSGLKQPEVFLKIMNMINKDKGIFVVDGGDLVYSGRVSEWGELFKVWKWDKPVFVAPGNHEYQMDGKNVYHRYFGPTDYSFSFGGYRFIFMDNTENDYSLSSSQWKWLEEELETAKKLKERPVIIMHAPPVDPRPHGDHSMKPSQGQKLLQLMKEYNAFGIFSHVHIYWYGEKDGVKFLVTGGGGAPLYASPANGGFYHYVRLTAAANGTISVEPVKVQP